MRFNMIQKTMIALVVGVITYIAAGTASAQNPAREYRDVQEAQRRVAEERREYIRTRSRNDYLDWQRARRDLQEERSEYQRASRVSSNRLNRWYRVRRGGRHYRMDNRGVEILRQAINRGYQQGYNAGVRDRRYRRGIGSYSSSPIYRTGTFGYQSYVARDQYQYYFREGFRRGYEDGYNNASLYGYRNGSNWSVLGSVIGSILDVVDDDN